MPNDILPGLSPAVHEFLRAVASETRQRLLLLFADGQERTVGQIADAAGLGQSTTSEHLATLRRAGLLKSHRLRQEVYYAPDGAQIVARLRELEAYLSRCCGGA